jgi:predicted  nucleic acid-binding Zn-ribbon protein
LSIHEHLDRLLELQAVDSERDLCARQHMQLDSGAKAQAALDAAQNESKQAHAAASASAGSLKDAELELSSVETKIADYEQRMRSGKLTNPREIANVEREIHQLSRQRSVLDDKILNLMEETEKDNEAVVTVDRRLHEASQALSDQRELSRETLDRLNQCDKRLGLQREALVSQLKGNALYTKYESVRAKPSSGGLAIVRVDSDRHCGGCHLPVSQQDAERVKEAAQSVICENCGRMLA